MKIVVDADACPVKSMIVAKAKSLKLRVIMVVDTSHEINDGYSTVVTVEQGRDSADIKLINLTEHGDIVVTQDFGVAALALGKGAKALNQNGLIYSDENMDRLLFERHVGQKVRRSGGRTRGPKKRSKENDEAFKIALDQLLREM